jgi:uncharacterized protein (TIGR00730 family)
MKISVFGGASPKPGSDAYQEAYQLGKLLAEAGFTVLTGGYVGTMEATSRGASEANGHVIGVTCEEIEAFRPGGPNAWVAEEWRRTNLRDRIDTLIESCDAAIALPGGIGTLAELCMTWNQLVIGAIQPKPLILMGMGWQKTIETMYTELSAYVPQKAREYVSFAPDPKATLAILEKTLNLK